MPNTDPPIFTIEQAEKYLQEIKTISKSKIKPLAALYLNEATSKEEIKQVPLYDEILGYKLYPKNATTGSNWGIKDLEKSYPLLEEMEKNDVPLMIHGEVNDEEVDIFDREKIFLEKNLAPLASAFPALRITLEHITTKEAVDFIRSANEKIKATITPHHLYLNRNAIFEKGINPHHYCLPIAKREKHRLALVRAATSGDEKFFLGSDSAPHAQANKENHCGCAGIYTAPHSVFLYLEIFYQEKVLEKFENFSSVFGKKHYNLSHEGASMVTLVRREQTIPEYFPYLTNDRLIPFKNGETISWSLGE